MSTLFNGKVSKQTRALIALGLLLFSLVGTQYLGFAHSISHAGFQGVNVELSTDDRAAFGISHAAADCHLFDALTLASFIAPDVQSSIGVLSYSGTFTPLLEVTVFQALASPYQSRAPPSITL